MDYLGLSVQHTKSVFVPTQELSFRFELIVYDDKTHCGEGREHSSEKKPA